MASDNNFESTQALRQQLQVLRDRLERVYRPDTSAPGFVGDTQSTGQCAATSVIARELLGGEMVSACVQNSSHWFNRFKVNETLVDADITGDQFGFPALQIALAGQLYSDTRIRAPDHLKEETLRRVRLLAERAKMSIVVHAMDAALNARRYDQKAHELGIADDGKNS